MKKVLAFLAMAALLLGACNKPAGGDDPNDKPDTPEVPDNPQDPEDPEEPELPKEIDVAGDALVAWLPMDDAATVNVGGLTLESQGPGTEANFVEGRRGKCYQGTENSYLLYNLPAGSPLLSLKAMSISMWLKHARVAGTPVPMVFQLTGGDDPLWGNFALTSDRMADDWITWKVQWQVGTYGHIWKQTDQAYLDEELGVNVFPWANVFPANRWNHIIWCYEPSVMVTDEETSETYQTSQFHCYVNGIDVTPDSYVWCMRAEKTAFGDLAFIDGGQLIIGGWYAKVVNGKKDSWMGDFHEGAVDEIRVFSRSLTADEAKALYDAEVDHMNE